MLLPRLQLVLLRQQKGAVYARTGGHVFMSSQAPACLRPIARRGLCLLPEDLPDERVGGGAAPQPPPLMVVAKCLSILC